MSRKYKFHDNDKLYFISFGVVNWIDVFIKEEYKQELIKSWQHCMEHKGLQIYRWSIMTSHVHMIIGTTGKKN
jgi:putative transposase